MTKIKNLAQLELNGVLAERIDADDVAIRIEEKTAVNFSKEISAACESKESCLPDASRTGVVKKNPRPTRANPVNEFPIMPDGERLLRIQEVAGLLRMSDKTVRRMIDAGQLTSKKIRGLRLIRWSDLSHMLNQTA